MIIDDVFADGLIERTVRHFTPEEMANLHRQKDRLTEHQSRVAARRVRRAAADPAKTVAVRTREAAAKRRRYDSDPAYRDRECARAARNRNRAGKCVTAGCLHDRLQFGSGNFDARCFMCKWQHDYNRRSRLIFARCDARLAELRDRKREFYKEIGIDPTAVDLDAPVTEVLR